MTDVKENKTIDEAKELLNLVREGKYFLKDSKVVVEKNWYDDGITFTKVGGRGGDVKTISLTTPELKEGLMLLELEQLCKEARVKDVRKTEKVLEIQSFLDDDEEEGLF